MRTTRRKFLQTSAIASLAAVGSIDVAAQDDLRSPTRNRGELDAFEKAGRHPLVRTTPGPTYFEGMLLGNGDVGVCAVVRPDALAFHISKSDCWDIRVTEGSEKEVRPFSEILEMWRQANAAVKRDGKGDALTIDGDQAFHAFHEKVGAAYRESWPRPWPCGTVWLKWDPRWVEPVLYSLSPANGLFSLEFKLTTIEGERSSAHLTALVDWES